mgnify:CR=1 FL=1
MSEEEEKFLPLLKRFCNSFIGFFVDEERTELHRREYTLTALLFSFSSFFKKVMKNCLRCAIINEILLNCESSRIFAADSIQFIY